MMYKAAVLATITATRTAFFSQSRLAARLRKPNMSALKSVAIAFPRPARILTGATSVVVFNLQPRRARGIVFGTQFGVTAFRIR